jgi:hypothetical protein
MQPSLLQRVNFGHIDAEADRNLIRYFLETESYNRIFNGEKMYVIGRKGTGKSAIYLTIENMKHPYVIVSGLSFDDYPWQIHNKIKDESKSIDFSHVNTWKYIVFVEMAKIIIKQNPDTSSLETKEIKEFLEVIYGTLAPSFKEFLVDKMKRIKCLELPKISWKEIRAGKIEFEEKSSPEKNLISSINIINNILQDKLLKLLAKDQMYFIMFDKLDDGWDNSEDFKSSMVGLLRACRDINLEARKFGKMLRCVPFLRSDIYDCLQYNDKNKAYPDIEFLNWNEENLRVIINKRILSSLNQEMVDAWNLVFDKKLLARKTTNFNYIVKRTLLRPRDIIQFCANGKQEALKRGHLQILNDDIYDGEYPYSEYIYREFEDEAHKRFPFIAQLFEILRSLHYERFTFEDFEREYAKLTSFTIMPEMNPVNALKILFDFSIIGVERIGGTGGGSTVEFKYTDPLIQPDFKRIMVIHPALKKHLKLVEKRQFASGI